VRGIGTEGPTFRKAKHGAPAQKGKDEEGFFDYMAARPEARDARKGRPRLSYRASAPCREPRAQNLSSE
jgi:hypothetical protein